ALPIYLPAIPHQNVVNAIAEEGDVLPSPRDGPHRLVLQVGRNFREHSARIVAQPDAAAAGHQQLRTQRTVKPMHSPDRLLGSGVAPQHVTPAYRCLARTLEYQIPALSGFVWAQKMRRVLQVKAAAEVIQKQKLLARRRHQNQSSGCHTSRTICPSACSS